MIDDGCANKKQTRRKKHAFIRCVWTQSRPTTLYTHLFGSVRGMHTLLTRICQFDEFPISLCYAFISHPRGMIPSIQLTWFITFHSSFLSLVSVGYQLANNYLHVLLLALISPNPFWSTLLPDVTYGKCVPVSAWVKDWTRGLLFLNTILKNFASQHIFSEFVCDRLRSFDCCLE